MAEAEGIAGLDTSVAHPARVYDYWLGGTDNFAADREAAERVLAAAPGLGYRVRANRAFLGRAARYLAAEGPAGQYAGGGDRVPAGRPARSRGDPGSYLTVSHPAIDIHQSQANAQRVYNERVATPQTLRTREQVARFFTGLDLVEPGLVQVHQWRPDPGDSVPEGTVSAHGGVAGKPGVSQLPGQRLPGQRPRGPLEDRVEVVAHARAVERPSPVGQQLAHHRHALSGDRARHGEGAGQPVQFRCGTGDPVPAERDIRLTRGAS
jgi:hypothetical protein